MGFMQRFERSLESSAGNVFARVFGGELTPLEVENALRREAGEQLQQLPDGQLVAPNHFRVTLSVSDASRFAQDEATSPRVVSRHLDTYLYDQDWGVVGDVVVEFDSTQDLHTGQYRLISEYDDKADASTLPRTVTSTVHNSSSASTVSPSETGDASELAGVAAVATVGGSDATGALSGLSGVTELSTTAGTSGGTRRTAAFLLDKETGTRLFVLKTGSNLLGRGDDVDFRIPDTGVSRHHARVEWDGSIATITDLNSTNGTAVNGIRISQWQLAATDEIIVGHTHLLLGMQ